MKMCTFGAPFERRIIICFASNNASGREEAPTHTHFLPPRAVSGGGKTLRFGAKNFPPKPSAHASASVSSRHTHTDACVSVRVTLDHLPSLCEDGVMLPLLLCMRFRTMNFVCVCLWLLWGVRGNVKTETKEGHVRSTHK